MGQRGPAPTPTNILKGRGSWRATKNRREPHPQLGQPPCPEWLTEDGKKEWAHVAELVDGMGVMSHVDGEALGRYCHLITQWRELQDFITKNGISYPVRTPIIRDAKGAEIGGGDILSFRLFPQVRVAKELTRELARLEAEFGLTPAARSRIIVQGTTKEADIVTGKGRFFATGS